MLKPQESSPYRATPVPGLVQAWSAHTSMAERGRLRVALRFTNNTQFTWVDVSRVGSRPPSAHKDWDKHTLFRSPVTHHTTFNALQPPLTSAILSPSPFSVSNSPTELPAYLTFPRYSAPCHDLFRRDLISMMSPRCLMIPRGAANWLEPGSRLRAKQSCAAPRLAKRRDLLCPSHLAFRMEHKRTKGKSWRNSHQHRSISQSC